MPFAGILTCVMGRRNCSLFDLNAYTPPPVAECRERSLLYSCTGGRLELDQLAKEWTCEYGWFHVVQICTTLTLGGEGKGMENTVAGITIWGCRRSCSDVRSSKSRCQSKTGQNVLARVLVPSGSLLCAIGLLRRSRST